MRKMREYNKYIVIYGTVGFLNKCRALLSFLIFFMYVIDRI